MGLKSWPPTRRAAENLPGVRQVIRLDQTLAVCADSLEAAWQGRDLLQISWSPGSQPELSDAGLENLFLASPGPTRRHRPAIPGTRRIKLWSTAPAAIRPNTFLPYLAHATMEPMNCLADVRPESCEIWVPVQNQTKALETAQQLTGLPPEKILIHTTFLGGGFGRRLEVDYLAEAVRLSQASGQPVKLVWTREEDFRYDFFRPMTATRIRAGLDQQGRVQAWDHTIAAPSIFARSYPAALKKGFDPAAVEGARHLTYDIPHLRVSYVRVDTPIPVGFWRSVGHSHNAFTVESCIDELAHLAGQDPLEFRLAHLAPGSRAGRVLTVAAAKAGWGKPLPPGRALGLAQHFPSAAMWPRWPKSQRTKNPVKSTSIGSSAPWTAAPWSIRIPWWPRWKAASSSASAPPSMNRSVSIKAGSKPGIFPTIPS